MAQKVVGLILNLVFPGIGTLVLGGRTATGVVQLVLCAGGVTLRYAAGSSLALFGWALAFAMFVWAVVLSIMAFLKDSSRSGSLRRGRGRDRTGEPWRRRARAADSLSGGDRCARGVELRTGLGSAPLQGGARPFDHVQVTHLEAS